MKVLLFENWQKTFDSDPSEGLLFTMVCWNLYQPPYFLATLNVKVDASTTISFLGRLCESKKQSKFYAAAEAYRLLMQDDDNYGLPLDPLWGKFHRQARIRERMMKKFEDGDKRVLFWLDRFFERETNELKKHTFRSDSMDIKEQGYWTVRFEDNSAKSVIEKKVIYTIFEDIKVEVGDENAVTVIWELCTRILLKKYESYIEDCA